MNTHPVLNKFSWLNKPALVRFPARFCRCRRMCNWRRGRGRSWRPPRGGSTTRRCQTRPKGKKSTLDFLTYVESELMTTSGWSFISATHESINISRTNCSNAWNFNQLFMRVCMDNYQNFNEIKWKLQFL